MQEGRCGEHFRRQIVNKTFADLGKIDVIVNNAG
jgi:NADP-dependent 3-hydroxy acid dehydrogenase YdfG